MSANIIRVPYPAAGGAPPLGIPDLQLWIDASQETGFSNGDEVSTAQDWSGNGRHATGVVDNTLKPTYRATDGPNSKPAFRFQNDITEQGGFFTLPNFLSGSEGHHFTVMKLDIEPDVNARAGPPLGDWGTATQVEFYGNPADGKIYSEFGSTVRHATANPAAALTNWHVYEERTALNDWSNWIDAVMNDQKLTNTVAWGASPKIDRHGIGGTSTLWGMIATTIFYNRILDAGEIATIYAHFNDFYGFSL